MAENDRFDVCSLEELQRAGAKAFPFRSPKYGYHEIAVFWDGMQVYALENCCPHRFASLAQGTLATGMVTCPAHGLQFYLATGKCMDGWGMDTEPYRADITEGRVWVEAPGETLLPRSPFSVPWLQPSSPSSPQS